LFRTVQQENEVFGVGIVGEPAIADELELSFVYLFLEHVRSRRARIQADAQPLHLLGDQPDQQAPAGVIAVLSKPSTNFWPVLGSVPPG
jgi:hypothetical protein